MHAFLIIAHDQPQHLTRLCRALEHGQNHCFVHVDPSLTEPFALPANATLIPDPIPVNRGGLSLTLAMLKLLKFALRDPAVETFSFLSGQDYPIKSGSEISTRLHQGRESNFINFYALTPDASYYDTISQRFYIDSINALPPWLVRPAKLAQRIGQKVLPSRKIPFAHQVFRGSQWSTLCRSSAEFVVSFANTPAGREYLRFFSKSWGSDEMFFQTALLNSPERARCTGVELEPTSGRKNENKVYLHYVDWDLAREGPAILDQRDYQMLIDSDFLFARKFDPHRSQDLLHQIDLYRTRN